MGRNALGVVVAAIVIPLGIGLTLMTIPFGRSISRTPEDVARYLRNFIEGTGDEWDFDDFISIPIDDPRLESIRERASRFAGPEVDKGLLRTLLAEAESLTADQL